MRNDLHKARRLVYGELKKRIPDVTLDDDRLTGSAYESLWTSDFLEKLGVQEKILSYCNDIFSDGTDIVLMLEKI